jgi:hypothetical protein
MTRNLSSHTQFCEATAADAAAAAVAVAIVLPELQRFYGRVPLYKR